MSSEVSVITVFLDSNDEFAKNYFSKIFNSIQPTLVKIIELSKMECKVKNSTLENWNHFSQLKSSQRVWCLC